MTTPDGMTAANWRSHPHAPWAFRNVEAFLPGAVVPASDRALPLPAGPPLPPLTVAGNDGARLDLPAFMMTTHADGLIVLRHGEMVFEAYADGMTAGTRHLCFSVTKALVGLIAERLIARRDIDAAATVSSLVPALRSTMFAAARLRDLLDMVDGVPFDETYGDPAADIHIYSRHFWGDGAGGVVAALQRLDRDRAPRPGFAYRTPVIDVVGLMLECATGRPLDTLLGAEAWAPGGAADDAYWVRDTGGRPIASAGLACTLPDLARVGQWLLRARGPSDLATAIASLHGGGDRAAFARADQPTRPGWSYRSGWWVDHPRGAINALGVFGQRLHINPAAGLVVARFGSHPVASNAMTDGVHARLFAALSTA